MMSLLSNGKYNKGFGNIPIAKAVANKNNDGIDDDRTNETTSSCNIINLPGDCLNLIFKCLKSRDRNSFGLTCRQWFHIQNKNQEFLVICYPWSDGRASLDEILLCKLLTRFQHLKQLTLKHISYFVIPNPKLFESKVPDLRLHRCNAYSHELSILFSWFPRLRFISLEYTYINDKGLEALSKCCSSLKEIRLSGCHSVTGSGLRCLLQNFRELHTLCIIRCKRITGIGLIERPKTLTHPEEKWCSSLKEVRLEQCPRITDSDISFLLRNFRQLNTLCIISCDKITGIGLRECPKTLTNFEATQCNIKLEGIKAIVSGGGLEYLSLSAPDELDELNGINTEAIVAISKGCPLLKTLELIRCKEIELEGWEVIGQNFKNLESLNVSKCRGVRLRALCVVCNKRSKFSIDTRDRCCSSCALELLKRMKPQCKVSFSFQGKFW